MDHDYQRMNESRNGTKNYIGYKAERKTREDMGR
jgi:hypothetical protein